MMRILGRQQIQDYGFRLYQPTIGKFLSRDPLSSSYPMLTPYQFASNSPISGIDLDGLEFKQVILYPNSDGTIDRYKTTVDIVKDALIYLDCQRVAQTAVKIIFPNKTSYSYNIFEEIDENGKNIAGLFPSAMYNFNDKDPNYNSESMQRVFDDGGFFAAFNNNGTYSRDALAPEAKQSNKDFLVASELLMTIIPFQLRPLKGIQKYTKVTFSPEVDKLILGNFVTGSSAKRKIPEIITMTRSGTLCNQGCKK